MGEAQAENATDISPRSAVARGGAKLTLFKRVRFDEYSHGTPLGGVRGGSLIV